VKTQTLQQSLVKGDVIEVVGKVTEFNGQVEISCNDQLKKLGNGEYDPLQFIKKGSKNTESLFLELEKYADMVANTDCKKLLDSFFDDALFVRDFKKFPASILRHHNWVGGLLEHTLNVVKLVVAYTKLYPTLDRDLLITCAILHDVGKLKEYSVSTTIQRTTIGVLAEHLMLSVIEVSRRMDALSTPSPLREKITHCIISHHGRKEWGSPVLPMMPEAMTLHIMDQLDAQVPHMLELKEGAARDEDFLFTKDFGNVFLK
jgi:3'-5' exoribonuclease